MKASDESLRELLHLAQREVPVGSTWLHVRDQTPARVVGHTFLAMPPSGEEWDGEITVRYTHGGDLEWARPLSNFRSRYVEAASPRPVSLRRAK